MDKDFGQLVLAAREVLVAVARTDCSLPASVHDKLAALRKLTEPLVDTALKHVSTTVPERYPTRIDDS